MSLGDFHPTMSHLAWWETLYGRPQCDACVLLCHPADPVELPYYELCSATGATSANDAGCTPLLLGTVSQ